MALTQFQKWMLWFDPLGKGRWDIANPAHYTDRHMDSFVNGLFLGRFWTRVVGGYNLRKRSDHTVPTKDDPIIGRSDGTATEIETGFLCEKTFSIGYVFGLSAVGALGVEGPVAALNEVVFPTSVEGELPNPPSNVQVFGLSNDEFRIDWRYNSIGQRIAPTHFRIYGDLGSGTIDESTSLADIEYVEGQVNYTHVLTGLSGLPASKYRAQFVVRSAIDLEGAHERNVNISFASNAPAAVEDVVELSIISAGFHLPERRE